MTEISYLENMNILCSGYENNVFIFVAAVRMNACEFMEINAKTFWT